jgi:hypothetical protein
MLAVVDVTTLRQRLSILGFSESVFFDAIDELIDRCGEMLIDADKEIYPKLVNSVRFLDHDFKPENGVSPVIKMIKSFASAGINNRILVILDNDAASAEAMLALPKKLPRNIVVIQYPELDLLKNYPTIGPQGEVNMDVNGLAGSIEMYMGEDILVDSSGELEKVQWGGYMQGVRRYQGSLLHKAETQERFRGKDKEDIAKWADLQRIWDYIIEILGQL